MHVTGHQAENCFVVYSSTCKPYDYAARLSLFLSFSLCLPWCLAHSLIILLSWVDIFRGHAHEHTRTRISLRPMTGKLFLSPVLLHPTYQLSAALAHASERVPISQSIDMFAALSEITT